MTLVHTAEFFSQFRSSSENNTSKCDDVKKNKMANIFEIFFFDFNFVNPKKKTAPVQALIAYLDQGRAGQGQVLVSIPGQVA